ADSDTNAAATPPITTQNPIIGQSSPPAASGSGQISRATTQPLALVASAGPTTQPVVVVPQLSPEELFAQCEQQFTEMSKSALADQKIADLKSKYESVAKSD